jgi:hypothetical protein
MDGLWMAYGWLMDGLWTACGRIVDGLCSVREAHSVNQQDPEYFPCMAMGTFRGACALTPRS